MILRLPVADLDEGRRRCGVWRPQLVACPRFPASQHCFASSSRSARSELQQSGRERIRIHHPQQPEEGIGLGKPCSKRMNRRRNGSLRTAKSAMSTQVCPPHMLGAMRRARAHEPRRRSGADRRARNRRRCRRISGRPETASCSVRRRRWPESGGRFPPTSRLGRTPRRRTPRARIHFAPTVFAPVSAVPSPRRGTPKCYGRRPECSPRTGCASAARTAAPPSPHSSTASPAAACSPRGPRSRSRPESHGRSASDSGSPSAGPSGRLKI